MLQIPIREFDLITALIEANRLGPAAAMFDAAELMSTNPGAAPEYQLFVF
jgi:hypothetical protein